MLLAHGSAEMSHRRGALGSGYEHLRSPRHVQAGPCLPGAARKLQWPGFRELARQPMDLPGGGERRKGGGAGEGGAGGREIPGM